MPRQATLYETLEVSPVASARVIKAAYRCLAQFTHPDKNSDAVSGERLAQINQAYAILSDPQQRHRYDLSLALHERTMQHANERRGSGATHRSPPKPATGAHLVARAFAFRPLD